MPNSLIRIPLTGGINLLKSPRAIEDDELVRTKNLVPVVPGRLRTRGAMVETGNVTLIGNLPVGAQFLPINAPAELVIFTRQVIDSFHAWLPSTTYQVGDEAYNGPNTYVCTVGGVSASSGGPIGTSAGIIDGTVHWNFEFPHVFDNLTRMEAFAGATGGDAALVTGNFGGSTQFAPACLPYQTKVYAFGGRGSTKNGLVLRSKDGGGIEIVDFIFAGSGNGDLRPTVVGLSRERFIYGNLGLGFESAILWADPFLPDTVGNNALAANGRNQQVGPSDGDRITAIYEIMQTSVGSPTSAAVLVLKEWSAYIITGEPKLSDGTGSDTQQVNRISINCGCASASTIAQTPYGIFWAGPDDVWFFPQGQVPYPVGTKIRPALKRSPPTVRYKWHAAYYNGFYRLAVFSEGQGPTDDSKCEEQYWLDLRDGPPASFKEAKWWGPQVFNSNFSDGYGNGTRCMTLEARPNSDRNLYAVDAGFANNAFVFGFDALSEFDGGASGSLVPAVDPQIEVDLISKEYDFGDPIIEKILQGVEVDVFPSESGVMYWKYLLGAGGQVSAEQSIAVEPPSGFQLDLDTLDSVSTLSTECLSIPLDPTPERPVNKTHQVELYSKGGYYISADRNIFECDVGTAPSLYLRVSVEIPVAFYATFTDLLNEVAAALTAAIFPSTHITITAAVIPYGRLTKSGTYPLNYGAAHCAVANQPRARALAQLLGFTNWDSNYTGLTSITATAIMPPKKVPLWEFGGATIRIRAIPRRPI